MQLVDCTHVQFIFQWKITTRASLLTRYYFGDGLSDAAVCVYVCVLHQH